MPYFFSAFPGAFPRKFISIVPIAVLILFCSTSSSLAWVEIVSPGSDSTKSGTITVQAKISNEWWSQLQVDGKSIATSSVGNGNAYFTWNTAGVSDGPHWVTVLGHLKGQSSANSSARVAVSVLNHKSADLSMHFPTRSEWSPLPSGYWCSQVIPWETEPVSGNYTNNNTVPTSSQLQSYAANGYSPNMYDGRWAYSRVNGQYKGTTDMILRWTACKWGLDEDAVRAQSINESWNWNQNAHGDYRSSYSQCVNGGFSALWNYQCTNCCYQSWSIFQVKVYYDWQTWPMIKQSTAFAADFRYANQRSCMDGDLKDYFAQFPDYNSHDYDTDVAAGNTSTLLWGCIGAHFSGQWYDDKAITYIGHIKNLLSSKPWKTKWTSVNWPD